MPNPLRMWAGIAAELMVEKHDIVTSTFGDLVSRGD
jgi:hypothetical protein